MVRGKTDNTCTGIEEVVHSYSIEKLQAVFQISKIPKQLTRMVALDVAVSNTSKCLAREATCCMCKTQGHYQCVDQSPIWKQYEQTLSMRNFLGTIKITATHSKDNQWMIELLLNRNT